jgi:hypothetical protein
MTDGVMSEGINPAWPVTATIHKKNQVRQGFAPAPAWPRNEYDRPMDPT